MSKIFFSIITPTFNRVASGYLEQCIRSVQLQELANFNYEHIIIDDGSTDETKKLIETINNNSKIRYLHQRNSGPAKAIKKGIDEANGEFIIILDDDDMLTQQSLLKRFQYIQRNNNVDWFYGLAEWIDDYGLPIPPKFQSQYFEDYLYERMLIANCVHGGTPTIRSSILNSVHWPEWLNRSQDYFLWLELLRPEKRLKVGFINESVVKYRFHSQNYTALITSADQKKAKHDLNLKIKSLHNPSLVYLAQEAFYWSEEAHSTNIYWLDHLKEKDKELNLLYKTNHNYRNSRFIGRLIKLRNFIIKTKKLSLSIIYKYKEKILNKLSSKKTVQYITIKNSKWQTDQPLVSVITPYYNRYDTMPETIQSVLSQSFQNFEYIIVDDGSTKAESIDYLSKIRHPKIRIFHQSNKGVAAARNYGIQQAKGKYILCIDSDDKIDKNYIEKAVLALEVDPSISLVTFDMQMFGEQNDVFRYPSYNPNLLLKDNYIITAAVFKKEAWTATGGYKNDIGYEDWEFWVDITERGYFGKHIPEVLFKYRTAKSSRYTEDLNNHHINANFIRNTHPNYKTKVKYFVKKNKINKTIIDPSTALINVNKTGDYLLRKNNLSNVLIAVPWMTFGGAETLIYNFCSEIKGSFNISFITGLTSKHEWEYKFKEISPDIYHLANLFNEDRKLYQEFIVNYLKTRNIEVLHIIHNGYLFDMLPKIKKELPKLKVIVTMFNDRVEYFSQSVASSKYINKFSTDNQIVAANYIKKIGDAKRVVLIPNGINTDEKYNPLRYDSTHERNELAIKQDEIAIFFIGRLSEEKNPDVFIKTAQEVITNNQKTKTKFFVIGDGPMRKQVISMIHGIDSDKIEYLGYKSDVANYLSAADVFVLPSAIEGFPLSILEAMSMEVVVVASHVGAVPDIITNGEDGFVISPAGSVTKFAEAISDLERNNVQIQKLKIAARKKVSGKYSSTTLGKNYLNLYRSVLK